MIKVSESCLVSTVVGNRINFQLLNSVQNDDLFTHIQTYNADIYSIKVHWKIEQLCEKKCNNAIRPTRHCSAVLHVKKFC